MNYMQIKNPALQLYFLSSIITVLSYIFQWDLMVLLCKPIIVPSIMYFYFQKVRFKFDWLFVLAIFFSFSSDMLVLIDFESNIPVALLNLFVYLIFIHFLIHDFFHNRITRKNLHQFLIVFLGFLGLEYLIFDLFQEINGISYYLYVFYGVVLSLLCALAIFLNLILNTTRTFNVLLMAISFLITDVFYALYHFQVQLEIFMYINLAAQFISYYYMIKYVTTDNEINADLEGNELDV